MKSRQIVTTRVYLRIQRRNWLELIFLTIRIVSNLQIGTLDPGCQQTQSQSLAHCPTLLSCRCCRPCQADCPRSFIEVHRPHRFPPHHWRDTGARPQCCQALAEPPRHRQPPQPIVVSTRLAKRIPNVSYA
jgi:hypothetical protein